MSDRKPTTVLVRIIGGEEYDNCAPELLAEDVMPDFSDGVTWEIVRLSDAEARIADITKWRDEWKDMATELKSLVEEWQARAEAAEALLKEERDKALEEAAKVAEEYEATGDEYDDGQKLSIAAAIRKLKGKL